MKKKSIKELTKQRNEIQEWLINSGAWKRHPNMYKNVEKAWQRYASNIEIRTGKKLVNEGFKSVFAATRYEYL